jgi:hypothetical protein
MTGPNEKRIQAAGTAVLRWLYSVSATLRYFLPRMNLLAERRYPLSKVETCEPGKENSESMSKEEGNAEVMHEIGEAAGKIWQFLNSESSVVLGHINKRLKFEEVVFWMAVGWLAREDKISFAGHGRQSKVTLK